jgi:hypothetical protein
MNASAYCHKSLTSGKGGRTNRQHRKDEAPNLGQDVGEEDSACAGCRVPVFSRCRPKTLRHQRLRTRGPGTAEREEWQEGDQKGARVVVSHQESCENHRSCRSAAKRYPADVPGTVQGRQTFIATTRAQAETSPYQTRPMKSMI